jgi:hypothetical protein
MGRRIVKLFSLVVRRSDDSFPMHDYRAHGYLALDFGEHGFFQSEAHQLFMHVVIDRSGRELSAALAPHQRATASAL